MTSRSAAHQFIEPRFRVVMLGASNLTRGIAAATATARAVLGGAADFRIAFGNGRSYGIQSRVFMRDLPGIRSCGLWPSLRSAARLETYALLCDIGNDLPYEQPVSAIEAWLRFALDELAAQDARVSLMQLPVKHLLRVTEAQFAFVKWVLFPGRPLQLGALKDSVTLLAERVATIAKEYGAALIEQNDAWYRFDPIHYPRSRQPEVWHVAMRGWSKGSEAPLAKPSLATWVYLRSRVPELRWIFGREQRGAQPCGVLADGSKISIY